MKYIKTLPDGRYEIRQDSSTEASNDIYLLTDAEFDSLLSGDMTFTGTEIVAATSALPTPPEINPVSMRQARLALLQSGLLDQVNSAILLGSPADIIEWEYATEVSRSSPLVENLSQALGLTSEQLNSLFSLAATL